MRLDKYLADMGAGTRSELKKIIRAKRVLVDGAVIRDPGFAVKEGAQVLLDGEPVVYEAFVYYMLNKPAGVITATQDAGQRTVLDLIDEQHRTGLFPVGRLDKDTEGLLLITNDGQTAHNLLAPGKHVDKTYFARVNGTVTEADVVAFRNGLFVDEDFTAMPADLKILSVANSSAGDDSAGDVSDGSDPVESVSTGSVSEVEITIREGKFHQIKRMFHAVGKEVRYLKRLSMGPLVLDPALQPGEYRRLTKEEQSYIIIRQDGTERVMDRH